MAIEVFNRYEKKYILDEHTFRRLLERINDYMELDKYNLNGQFYSICNIYYDTDDNRLIRSSIEKPVYKEKLRMRSYGTPCGEDRVFLEIKKKYNGIVNKRRTSIVLKDAYKYMESDVYPESDTQCINTQVLKEIDYFKKMYTLKPKVYLSYDRYAYFEKNDGDFRVTFDTNITTRRGDVRLESGSYGNKLIPDRLYLMEIKISGAVPMWFTRCLSDLHIYPVSFSKYGTEYKRYVLEGYDKDTEELSNQIAPVFFTMAAGLACGLGYVTFAAAFTAVMLLLLILISAFGFADRNEGRKQLKIVIPESLNYNSVFDDLFDKYTSENRLNKVKTTNMGTMYELTYEIRLKNDDAEKDFIDELRVRNGNLNISVGIMPENSVSALN